MKTKLIIYYDASFSHCLSFREVEKYEGSDFDVCTNCLVFFQFKMLEKFMDVVLRYGTKHISLKQLLENNPGQYTKKEIRKKHNALKMFLAGALEWQE